MGRCINGGEAGQSSPAEEISGEVSAWMADMSSFLRVVQAAMEHMEPKAGTHADVRQIISEIPSQIRQRRSQVPTPEMVRTWVDVLTEEGSRRVFRGS